MGKCISFLFFIVNYLVIGKCGGTMLPKRTTSCSPSINGLILLVFLVILGQAHILPKVNDQEEPKPCQVYSSYSSRTFPGQCKPLIECPSAIGLLKAGVLPTMCPSTNGNGGSTVCCANKRISAEKCDEFSNIFMQPVRGKGALMYDGSTSQRKNDDGSIKCEAFLVTFITGGRNAREREYPYQVAIGYGDKPDWRCGGTLIDAQWVISAAHCGRTNFGPPTMVLLGDRRLSTRKDPSRLILNVSQVILHPKFRPPVQYNDIALLKLESPVELSRAISPACLPDPSDRLDRILGIEATGWGQTSAFGGQSDLLQSATLAKFDINECTKFFDSDKGNKKRLPKGIIRSQFCAGDKQGYRDTCKGDSGGPITVTKGNEKCVHYIMGVTSFGSNLCGFQQPGVYTNILSYLDWIEDTVWYNLSTSKNTNQYSSGELILNMNPSEVQTTSPTSIATVKDSVKDSTPISNPPSTETQTSQSSSKGTVPPPLAEETSPLTSTLQQILFEVNSTPIPIATTTNLPSLTQINDMSYMSRISSSISNLLSNISIGR